MGSPAPAVLAFIALVLVILPLPWHYRTKNIATLSIAFWLAQGNLFLAINSIVWMDNVQVKFLRYCNIGVSFQVAGTLGLVSASLCIMRNLERIASPRTSRGDLSNNRREKIFDFFMCIVLPFIYSALQYIVAPCQLNIVETLGCQLPGFRSWPAVVLSNLPPLVLATTTFTYAALTIQWLQLRRGTMGKVLRQSQTSMTLLQFMRLMALAIVLSSVALGYGIFQLHVFFPLEPWVSWDNVHNGFREVGQYPFAILSPDQRATAQAFWAVQPVSALIFFLLFGPTVQALNDIASGWQWVKKRIGRPSIGGSRRPKGAQTLNSSASQSAVTDSVSIPAVGTAKSKAAMSASERWANGDDLDFDEGDDESVISDSVTSGTVSKDLQPLESFTTLDKTPTSPSSPVNVSFSRSHTVLRETVPSPTTPTLGGYTGQEPPGSIVLKPIGGARVPLGRNRASFV